MSDDEFKPQLRMLRPTLEALPPVNLPEGYALRSYLPGDASHWSRIIATSFNSDIEAFDFERIMRNDVAFRPERIWFITHNDEPVATASAYQRPVMIPDAGMIHYVGALSGHSGKKLGYWVSLGALLQMEREGFVSSWLDTDDFRLPAVKTYLNLGFVPLVIHENQRARWRTVFEKLGLPELCDEHEGILDGPLWTPPVSPPDLCDYPASVVQRRRLYPARPAGTRQQDDLPARSDESLYCASALGTAGCSLSEVVAGEDAPFELWFRVGTAGLDAGSEVRFYSAGQRPLGAGLQMSDPAVPGYVEVTSAPEGVQLDALNLGFGLTDGALNEGDHVRLRVGGEGGFRWTALACRKDMHVVVDVGRGEPTRRLPEPVVVRVLPGPAEKAVVRLPLTVPPGAVVEGRVTMRDGLDNRTDWDGATAVSSGGRAGAAVISEGSGRVRLNGEGEDGKLVRIELGEGSPAKETEANACRLTDGLQLYVGDLHVHDSTCEAFGYLEDAYRRARDDERLDFLSPAVQCHNWIDNDKWQVIKRGAEAFLDEGRFVTFPAFEWQHAAYGDKVVHFLSGDALYLPVDDPKFDHPWKLYEALRQSDAFVISHHPGYVLNKWVPGTDFDLMQTDVDVALELWSMHGSSEGYSPDDRPLHNGRREEGVMGALRQGLRVALLAGSDTHAARPGGSHHEPLGYHGGLAAVWAESLTRRGLAEAIRARRTYALTGARIGLRFTVNDAPMGSAIPAADRYHLRAEVWAPSRIAKVEFLRSGRLVASDEPGAEGCVTEGHEAHPEGSEALFYNCRVTLDDGHLAVCTPVYVDAPETV